MSKPANNRGERNRVFYLCHTKDDRLAELSIRDRLDIAAECDHRPQFKARAAQIRAGIVDALFAQLEANTP